MQHIKIDAIFLGWARQERPYGQEGNPWTKGFINCYFIRVVCLYGDVTAIIPLLCVSAPQGNHGERGIIGLPGKGNMVGFIFFYNIWAHT